MFDAYAPDMSSHQPDDRPPESAQAGTYQDPSEPFAVDRILVDELPRTLGTVEAPERYVVAALFTRRPLPQELDLLRDPSVGERLAAAGYPRVTLGTSDRRLLIGNTNLHELKAGLASTIGTILDEIGRVTARMRSAQAKDAAEAATRDTERAQSVLVEASGIDFTPASHAAKRTPRPSLYT